MVWFAVTRAGIRLFTCWGLGDVVIYWRIFTSVMTIAGSGSALFSKGSEDTVYVTIPNTTVPKCSIAHHSH